MTSPIPDGSVIITPAQVYDKVNELTVAVTELLARDKADDQRQADQKEAQLRREAEAARRESDQKAEMEAVKLRVSALERKVYIVAGFSAAIGAGLGGYLPSVLGG